MDLSPHTLALARVLFGMAERKSSCVLSVWAGPRHVKLFVRLGRLYALEGTGHALLGDMLLAQGVDVQVLRDLGSREHVGSELVARGLVSAKALGRGLQALHVARMRWLFAHAELRMGALAALPPLGTRLRASVPLAGAVLDAQLHAAHATFQAKDDDAWPALSPRGARARAELTALPAAPPAHDDLGARRTRQVRCLHALALVPHDAAHARCAELVRVRRALARDGAERVLDLPAGAGPAEARRRVRTLARSLHPDLFAREHPALAEEAGAMLAALTRAADALTWGRTRTA